MQAHYERLSALDAAFLEIETSNCHMHVGIALLFDAEPLTLEHGGIDIDRLRTFVEARIQHIPRYRQRLEYVPLQRHPVWVDDDGFNLEYHVRHAALPRPGSMRQLKRLIARINSQKLDRSRPLWEMWLVEGIDEGDKRHFALIGKVHHCMMDGASGVDVMAALLRLDPSTPDLPAAPTWRPRPAPRSGELLGEEVRRQRGRVGDLLSRLGQIREDPQGAIDNLKGAASNVLATIGSGVVPASRTPLNPSAIGSYRRFDWVELPLAEAKRIKRALGGTVNDVVLASVTGALRHYFLERQVDVARLDFRVLMPVNARSGGGGAKLGNRVSVMLARLPLEQPDPAQRLQRVTELTLEAKSSGQHQGAELVEELGDVTGTMLISSGMRLATRIRSYNLVVTNVPGPPVPLYLLGARMLAAYPVVPLYLNQALGIAVFGYDGSLFFGLNADWDRVPDLHALAEALEREFAALKATAATSEQAMARPESAHDDDQPEVPPRSGAKTAGAGSAHKQQPPSQAARQTSQGEAPL